MAEGGGVGRGGRGAALYEAILALQKNPGNEDVAAGGDDALALPVAPRGRGRASLSQLLEQRAISEPPSTPFGGAGDTNRPVGRGRSALAASMAVARGRAALVRTEEPQPIAQQPSLRGPLPARSPPTKPSSSRLPTAEMAQMSIRENPPVIRKGASGKPFATTANYVRLILEPGKGVFEYEVRFDPDVDAKAMRSRMLHQALSDIAGARTFDGVTLYLPFKLREETVLYSATHPVDETPVQVNIIYKRQKRMGECIHLYNVLFRRIMGALDLARIGRQHYSPKDAHLIPQHKLEVWPGFVTAVDEYEGGIQLCCDSSHRVLRMQTVLSFIGDCAMKSASHYKEEVQKGLIGASVLTRYNNKVYRIDDLTWDKTPLTTFATYSGDEISFQQYYKKQYNLEINDLEQPLLINRLKKKIPGQETVEQHICLVPELCYLTGLTDEMRSDFRVMKDIATYTRISPNQRQLALKKFINNVKTNVRAQQLLSDWGLSMEQHIMSVEGRVLDPEMIYFGGNVSQRSSLQADWSGAATRSEVLTAIDLNNWIILHAPRDNRFANDFARMMKTVGPQMGVQVNDGRLCPLRDDRTESYLRCLRENITNTMQVVVLICPTSRDDRYSAIKKLCCVEKPIASQVINSRTLSKPDKLRSIVQKIALQINCKLGGTLWAVKIPFENWMVCGIDSFHCATKRGASVAGFVASLNTPLTRWFSKVCFQGPQQEVVDGLKICFIASLKKYFEVNHRFPDRIVIYRDGVGDGQLKTCKEYEVPQFASCFSLINPSYKPNLTVVICQKRINTRIFRDCHGSSDGDQNVPPGTIVDHTITRRDWYDFFLVSQHVRQGTVTPTHYVVIHDETPMKTDQIQRLTYKMCHMYYNWPGTVRVPAPCQYAHKLAYLVGQSINRDPSEKLADRLYFL